MHQVKGRNCWADWISNNIIAYIIYRTQYNSILFIYFFQSEKEWSWIANWWCPANAIMLAQNLNKKKHFKIYRSSHVKTRFHLRFHVTCIWSHGNVVLNLFFTFPCDHLISNQMGTKTNLHLHALDFAKFRYKSNRSMSCGSIRSYVLQQTRLQYGSYFRRYWKNL